LEWRIEKAHVPIIRHTARDYGFYRKQPSNLKRPSRISRVARVDVAEFNQWFHDFPRVRISDKVTQSARSLNCLLDSAARAYALIVNL
jgi:hypothetical protein